MNQTRREAWVRRGEVWPVWAGVLAMCLLVIGCDPTRTFLITAQPPHAMIDVIDEQGGSAAAEYQFDWTFRRGQEEVAVRVTAPGYQPETLVLNRSSEVKQSVELEPLRRTVGFRVIPAAARVEPTRRPITLHDEAVELRSLGSGTYELSLVFGHVRTGPPVGQQWPIPEYELRLSGRGLQTEILRFRFDESRGAIVVERPADGAGLSARRAGDDGGRDQTGAERPTVFLLDSAGGRALLNPIRMRPVSLERTLVFGYADRQEVQGLRVSVDGEPAPVEQGNTVTIRFDEERMRVDRKVRVVAESDHFKPVTIELDWLEGSTATRPVDLEPPRHEVTVVLAIDGEQDLGEIDSEDIQVGIWDESGRTHPARGRVESRQGETVQLKIQDLTFPPADNHRLETRTIRVEARLGEQLWRGWRSIGREDVGQPLTLQLLDSRYTPVTNRSVRVGPGSGDEGGPWQFRMEDSEPVLARNVLHGSSDVALAYEPAWPWDVLSFDVHPSGRWMVVSEIAPDRGHRRGFKTRMVLVHLATDEEPRELIRSDRRSWMMEPRFSRTGGGITLWYLSDAVGEEEAIPPRVRLWRMTLSEDDGASRPHQAVVDAPEGRQYVAFDELVDGRTSVLVLREVEWETGESRLVTRRPSAARRGEWEDGIAIVARDVDGAGGRFDGHRIRTSPTGPRMLVSRQREEGIDRDRTYLFDLVSRKEQHGGGFVYENMTVIRQDSDERLNRLLVWSPCGGRLAWVHYRVDERLMVDWLGAGIETVRIDNGGFGIIRPVSIPGSDVELQALPGDQVVWSRDVPVEAGGGAGRMYFRYSGADSRAVWSIPVN